MPVNFLLDEFVNIGVLPDWDKKMATIRSRAMNAVMIVQDITQLKNYYEKSYKTILSNCSLWISLGINEYETAQFLSDRAGDFSARKDTIQIKAESDPLALITPRSISEDKRKLLSPAEIMEIPARKVLVIPARHNPFILSSFAHDKHPEFKYFSKTPIKDIPSIYDDAGRKAKREKENAYLKEYLEKHPVEKINRNYEGKCETHIVADEGIYEEATRILLKAKNKLLEAFNISKGKAIEMKAKIKEEFSDELTEEETYDIEKSVKELFDSTCVVNLETGEIFENVEEDDTEKEDIPMKESPKETKETREDEKEKSVENGDDYEEFPDDGIVDFEDDEDESESVRLYGKLSAKYN